MLDCSELKNVLFRSLAAECYWGGDLYEQEENFFRFVECRDENTVEEWVRSLKCPVIRIDGTKPVDENTSCIIARIQNKDMENGK